MFVIGWITFGLLKNFPDIEISSLTSKNEATDGYTIPYHLPNEIYFDSFIDREKSAEWWMKCEILREKNLKT